ncbi:MAG TPA: CDP-alcohol phosphatidyltransferase family protein [Candidatus Limnocylindrales bacterium]|nr:CDP-alcohol phosphatidyltransferase family protein [Candidatus Limnocylindrales bacterium]
MSSDFRHRVRSSIEGPVAGFFGRLGLTPNALTLIGFGIAIIGAYLAATQIWLLAGVVVAFGAIFDLFDGALARATNKTSKLGAFLDSVFDRAGEVVVYLGVAIGLMAVEHYVGAVLSAGAMAAAMMVSYTRAKSESLGFSSGSGMASVGLAPREVRTVMLVGGLIGAGALGGFQQVQCVTAPCPPVVGTGGFVLLGSLALIAIAATLTTLQRIYFVYQQSKHQPTTDPK